MSKRSHLGEFYQEHYQTGVGAEVGCLRGEFSLTLSKSYKGKILAIDSFDEHEGIAYDKSFVLTPFYMKGIEKTCREKLKRTKCEIIKGYSTEVAKTIPDESLDWVFIDADHRYESTKADLEAWFPKVRKGGVISGHDYKHFTVPTPSGDYVFGVIKAVDEFCAKHGYKLEGLLDLRRFASWYFTK